MQAGAGIGDWKVTGIKAFGLPMLTTQGATTGFNGTAASVTTGFSNITDLQGSGTLQGRDVASTWSVDTGSYSDGTRSLTFGSFATLRSEERRVGKEGRSRWSPYH